jgi:succinyl-CoA synthetase alpha subunit
VTALQKQLLQRKETNKMSILINKDTKVIVQGFTGKEGSFHAEQCLAYGTKIVGGVTPNKGGTTHLGQPVFNTVADAVKTTGATVSMIFVPPAFVGDAVMEAAEAGIELAVIITEGAPVKDMQMAKAYATKHGMKTLGPNCPGIITAEECKIGIMPGMIFKKGKVGLISKSGTLTYEGTNQVVKAGYGISTAVGIGGDPIIGLSYLQLLPMFEADPETECIVMIGEIGGDLEIQAARYIKENITKPVVAFIAGQTAPKGKTMGHAGAIVSGSAGTAVEKMAALEAAGATVVVSPAEIGKAVTKAMAKLNK